MGSPVLGIDLGTTNSAVAVAVDGKVQVLPDAEGNKLFPSVVSFHPSGDVLAGYPARERRLLDAQNTIYSIKRLIGRPFKSEEVQRAIGRLPFSFEEGPTGGALVVARGETYTLPEISAFVLRGVRAQAEEALKTPCRRAVITVPANFNELQRSATKAAGRVAGLDVLRILNEPTAAALAYGCGSNSTRERVAVYDFGGGTFDITILELAGDVFEVVSTAGDTFLGGDDVDVLVADEEVQAFLSQCRYDARNDPQAYERLRAAAEWAKCQLSNTQEVELTVEELAFGEGGAALDLRFVMKRARLEELSRPLVARTFDVCEEAMRLAGLRPTQLDQVILVGGSTRMPLVRTMVQEYFGRAPLSNIDPDLVVAQGAAIQGAALAGAPDKDAGVQGAAIGRVALKKVAAPAANVKEEKAPAGPAFQPKRPVAPLPSFDINKLPAAIPAVRTSQAAPAPNQAQASMRAAPPPLPAQQPANLQLDDDVDMAELPELDPIDLPSGDSSDGLVPLDLPSMDDSQPIQLSQTAPLAAAANDAIQLPQGQAPLLLDVTPQSLRIETVSGFTEVIIERNAAIPVEQSRLFTTSRDFQEAVRASVCQGESRKLAENQQLGLLELSGIASGPRGKAQIEVTFLMDADGTLKVSARDLRTGAAQTIRINLVGAVEDDEIARMQQRQQALVG
jgi:molecular chaperone DnaK